MTSPSLDFEMWAWSFPFDSRLDAVNSLDGHTVGDSTSFREWVQETLRMPELEDHTDLPPLWHELYLPTNSETTLRLPL